MSGRLALDSWVPMLISWDHTLLLGDDLHIRSRIPDCSLVRDQDSFWRNEISAENYESWNGLRNGLGNKNRLQRDQVREEGEWKLSEWSGVFLKLSN